MSGASVADALKAIRRTLVALAAEVASTNGGLRSGTRSALDEMEAAVRAVEAEDGSR